jgi:metal-sulfur cluster biosynthetic enzyme
MEIVENLRSVIDPELDLNIIDLGLVYEVGVDELNLEIKVIVTLSSKFCPMGDAILQSVKNCLEHHYPNYTICVQLTWEPQWNYEMISEEGRRQLSL